MFTKDIYTETITDFFMELQEESLQQLRQVDMEYNDWRTAHIEASQEYEAVLKNLPQKDMKIVEEFTSDMFRIIGREQDWIYLQGYKDCVKFLRMIELIR